MTAQAMTALARTQIGYRETGNNLTKYNEWLGRIPGYPHNGFGYPWCHSFLSWLLAQTDNASAGPRTAGCAVGVAWFRTRGRYHSTPRVGDFVYFGAGGATHVELVIGVSSSSITTIGGNTGGSLNGAYFNGDGVYQKSISRSSTRIHGYGRPDYAGTGSSAGMTSVRPVDYQQRAVNADGYTPKLDVDNAWGPLTDAGVRWYQGRLGVTVDAKWGPATDAAHLHRIGSAATPPAAKPAPAKPSTPKAPAFPGTLLRYPPATRHASVRTWQTQMRARGWKITVDGVYGPASKTICQQFQREKKLKADGIVGPATWRATWESPIT